MALPLLAVVLVAGLIAGVAFAAQRATSKDGAANSKTASDQSGSGSSNDAGSKPARPPKVVSTGTPSATPEATKSPTAPQTPPGSGDPSAEGKAFYTASLNGTNEVPGGKPAGDQDGSASALVEIEGDEIAFGLRWKGIGTPTAAHIHRAPAGKNGEVVVNFFVEQLPGGSTAVTGRVEADAAVITRIRANPQNYYVNLHTGEFPGGAVRAQLVPAQSGTDLKSVLGTDKLEQNKLVSENDGRQEDPAGDPDGRATAKVWPWGECLDYAITWSGIQAPRQAHVHKAPAGQNGKVVGDFFTQKLPDSLTGISGRTEGQDRAAMKRIQANPQNYYTNLHTADFPKGAVRGQLRQK